MNAYETYSSCEQNAAVLAVIWILGKIFIPKGTGKNIFNKIMMRIFVIMCLSMKEFGIPPLLLVFAAAFCYLTVWLYGERRNGLSFLFLLLTIICAFLLFNMGVRLYGYENTI